MSKRSRAESAAAMAATAELAPIRRRSIPAVAAPGAAAPAIADGLETLAGRRSSAQTYEVTLDRLVPSPLNPRRLVDQAELEPLARSIADKGLLQPILARPAPRGPGSTLEPYEIICGARRHAAACFARDKGWLDATWRMTTRVRECTDSELVILAATENLAREDMHPLDEAAVFEAMRPNVERQAGETSEAAIGRMLGIVSERTVFRRLSLLKCAQEVQDALRQGTITLGDAEAYSLYDHDKQREVLAAQLRTIEVAAEAGVAPMLIERVLARETAPASAPAKPVAKPASRPKAQVSAKSLLPPRRQPATAASEAEPETPIRKPWRPQGKVDAALALLREVRDGDYPTHAAAACYLGSIDDLATIVTWLAELQRLVVAKTEDRRP